MLKLLDKSLEDNDIWLNRYMPLKNSIYWLEKDKLKINFTRVELFDDVLEGWDSDFPSLKKAWLDFVNFSKRVTNDGGTVEAGNSIISFLQSNFRENSEVKINVKEEIDKYLKLIKSNYASCWFVSDSPNYEERYMWNIYGNSRNDDAFMISVKWSDIKYKLEYSSKKFVCGMIDYNDSGDKNPLFKKHFSYSHEKEFRIISEDFKNDFNYFEIDDSVQKIITLNEPISSYKYNKLKSTLNLQKDRIRYSSLPLQWKLNDLRKLL